MRVVGQVARAGWRAVSRVPDIDSALALLAFVALLVDPVLQHRSSGPSVPVVVLSAATALPLTARRRHPVPVLCLVLPLLLICLPVFHPNWTTVAIVMVLVFTVGADGGRLSSLVVGGVMAPVVAVAVLLTSRDHDVGGVEFVAYLALVLGALAAGEAVRARRALDREVSEEAARELVAQSQQRMSAERLRLANEVHDIVGHALVAIQVQATAAAHVARRTSGAVPPQSMTDIAATATEALDDLRATLGTLRAPEEPAPLHPAADVTDLRQLVRGVEAAGLVVDLQVSSAVPRTVPTAVAHAGYRIVQECLTNVLRHSSARSACVRIAVEGAHMTLGIADAGPQRAGTPTGTTAGSGRGIQGMTDRAAAVGGVCRAGPDGEDGWQVQARIPLAGAPR